MLALCDAGKSYLQVWGATESETQADRIVCITNFLLPIPVTTCYRLPATHMQDGSSHGIDRRPIATRNRKWAQDATAWLASRNVSPNAISIAGMCACIVGGIAIGLTSVFDWRILWLIGALGAQLRLTANMLDGMVAIASSRTSKTGELYNEVPDRISDAAVFIGAGYAWGGNVTLGYIATILAIFTAYIRAAGKIAGAPNEFCGPMAKQHRMLVITMICVYATITPRSWQIITFNDWQIGLMTLALVAIAVGCVITVVRRISRIVHALI
jgi:phosphatidylglycerophosphate synthase